MAKARSYKDYLLDQLKDPKEAESYLNAALEGGDPDVILLALSDIAKAQGGITLLAEKTDLKRANVSRMLSSRGNPTVVNLFLLLNAMGIHLKATLDRAA